MGLSEAYNAVIQACNDPNIGYTQNTSGSYTRYSIKLGVNYRTGCDCSSLMAWACTVGGYFAVNPWFSTYNEVQCLTGAGWAQLPSTSDLMPGDILWRHRSDTQHTEMVYEAYGKNCITMGAHSGSKPFPDQVSINSYQVAGSAYDAILRAPDSTGILTYISWSQGNGGFGQITEQQKYDNACLINAFFSSRGGTVEAIAGILGNLDHESGLDPNIWYGGVVGSVAYGLPQFNPASGYRNFAQSEGINLSDPDANGNFQLVCIAENLMGGWLPTSRYPYSFEEFLQLRDAQLACDAFYGEFERGGPAQYGDRDELTRYWLERIPGMPSNIGGPPRLKNYGFTWDLRRRLVFPR